MVEKEERLGGFPVVSVEDVLEDDTIQLSADPLTGLTLSGTIDGVDLYCDNFSNTFIEELHHVVLKAIEFRRSDKDYLRRQ